MQSPRHRLLFLDALRGLAAAWVLLSHVGNQNGFSHPLLLEGGFAVDLFMMLSGFLMVYNYVGRQTREPWDAPATWRAFWIRRFFRIAPLYYVVFACVLVLAPAIGELRGEIAAAFHHPNFETARYLDRSAANIALHVSFAFGFLPDYATRTPLPDWSIGLEAAYYLAFPAIMLLWKRGPASAATGLVFLSAALLAVFPVYFAAFPNPAALPIKLHIFVVGMLLATALWEERAIRRNAFWCLAVAMPMAGLVAEPFASCVVRCLLALGLAGLVLHGSLERRIPLFGHVAELLEHRFFLFLGEMSYAVYLVHLPVVVAVMALFVREPWFLNLSMTGRIALVSCMVAVPVYALAFLLNRLVERPGIAVGRSVAARARGHSGAAIAAVEKS